MRTGSGKTLAYLLPLLQLLLSSRRRSRAPGAVVLAPTRELAKQIALEAEALSKLPVACIFGGVPYRESIWDGNALAKSRRLGAKALRQGCDLLVATPGRLEDAAQRGDVQLRQVRCAVLDEADRLLDLGFEDQPPGALKGSLRPGSGCS